MTVRQTARGIGIRALILVVGIVVLGVWVAFEMIGAAIQLVVWVGGALIAIGVVAFVWYKIRRR